MQPFAGAHNHKNTTPRTERRPNADQWLTRVKNGPDGAETPLPVYPDEQTSLSRSVYLKRAQQRTSPLCSITSSPPATLAAMIIRATRLAAILVRIAQTSTLDSGCDDSFATVERPAEQRGVRREDYFQGPATDRPAGLLLSLAVTILDMFSSVEWF
jgi:hypothetical protein